jgi:hypothetical protein
MATIEERRRIYQAKLKEMSEDGIMQQPAKATLAFDPPDDDIQINGNTIDENSGTDNQTQQVGEIAHLQEGKEPMTIDRYRSTYFRMVFMRDRTNFTISAKTLTLLKNVLNDLSERTSISAYIDNIIMEHLKEHKDMLNNAASKQRRKTTITF